MLSVQNLSLTIEGKCLLKDVNFNLNPGEVVALCGESGSGKTLTALSIMRLIRQASYTGQILWHDTNLLALSDLQMQRMRSKEIGYIFQEPGLALNPTKKIKAQIEEVFLLHSEMPFDMKSTLLKAGLDNIDLDRYPHQLSGGQKQRVMIAMALALSPKLIIADEPTTALDRHLQKHIIDILRNRGKDTSLLLITHDVSVVKGFAHRIVVMKNGMIVEQGNTTEVLKNPKHDYTKQLIMADPPGKPIQTSEKAPVILSIEHLKKSVTSSFFWHKKETVLLKDISFSVRQGHAVGIVGESGSGKTTIAKIIVSIMKPTSGSILFHGRVINNLPYKDFLPLRRRIQYIFQDPYTSLNPRMTVKEILKETGLVTDTDHSDDTLRIILEQVGLDVSALSRFPNQFSGGQRQRVAIARALLLEPELLILDEPTSALDRSVQKNILLLLKDLQQKRNLTYIFISHDLQVIKSICHDVVVLKEGVVIEAGPTDRVFDNPTHPYAQLLLGGF